MYRRISIALGCLWALLLMVAALWIWQNAPALAEDRPRPAVFAWAARSAAIALAAGAQVVLLAFVVGPLYRRGGANDVLRLVATVVLSLAVVAALALALLGR